MTARRRWDEFWFGATGPLNLVAARTIVAANALWIVLSRPGLPDVVRWPDPFWKFVPSLVRLRYAIVPLSFAIESALYVALMIALVLVIAGIGVRPAAATAALLLYHFAPMEDIFVSRGGPFFRGFTILLLALLIVAFGPRAHRNEAPSQEFRWPLALMQLLFALTYLMSGLSKLRLTGWRWATGDTFESIVLAMMIPGSVPPWAHLLVGHPLLCGLGAIAGVAMDFALIAAVFSPRAARIIIPAALAAHLAIIPTLGIVFLSTPMLLIFVNWEWIAGRTKGAISKTPRISDALH